MDFFKHSWEQNTLDIAQACDTEVCLFLSGIPELQSVPEVIDLHELASTNPLEAMIRLVGDYVVQQSWWESFLEVMSQVGLESVREEFFDGPLRGIVRMRL